MGDRVEARGFPSGMLIRAAAFLHRPHFDTAKSSSRNLRSHPDGVVQVSHVDQKVSPQLFFRLGKGSVGSRGLSIADSNGRGGVHRMPWRGRNKLAVLLQFVTVGHRLVRERESLVPRQGIERLFFEIDQTNILHGILLRMGGVGLVPLYS